MKARPKCGTRGPVWPSASQCGTGSCACPSPSSVRTDDSCAPKRPMEIFISGPCRRRCRRSRRHLRGCWILRPSAPANAAPTRGDSKTRATRSAASVICAAKSPRSPTTRRAVCGVGPLVPRGPGHALDRPGLLDHCGGGGSAAARLRRSLTDSRVSARASRTTSATAGQSSRVHCAAIFWPSSPGTQITTALAPAALVLWRTVSGGLT